jgi:hypothetical protein
MGAFPSVNFFKIMQFSPQNNFTSFLFHSLKRKNHAIFLKIIGHGPLPLAVKKSWIQKCVLSWISPIFRALNSNLYIANKQLRTIPMFH